jgi:hypothetical protein
MENEHPREMSEGKEGAHGGTMGSPVLKLECGIHTNERNE